MIDVTKLQGSSLFAGFANLEAPIEGNVVIPGGQTIPGFSGGALVFTADVPRPNNQSLALVLFQVVGPATLDYGDGLGAYDSTQWKSSASDYAVWPHPDNNEFEIRCSVQHTTSDDVQLAVQYVTDQVASQIYAPIVTVNYRVFFFKYPWE